MWWLGSPQISLNYVRSSQGVFFGFGWRMVDWFFWCGITNLQQCRYHESSNFSIFFKTLCLRIKNKRPSLHVLEESKIIFLPNTSRFIPNLWLSAHIHLKKIKILGFNFGLAWKKHMQTKYAKNMQKKYLGMAFCGPKILLTLKLYQSKNYNLHQTSIYKLKTHTSLHPEKWSPVGPSTHESHLSNSNHLPLPDPWMRHWIGWTLSAGEFHVTNGSQRKTASRKTKAFPSRSWIWQFKVQVFWKPWTFYVWSPNVGGHESNLFLGGHVFTIPQKVTKSCEGVLFFTVFYFFCWKSIEFPKNCPIEPGKLLQILQVTLVEKTWPREFNLQIKISFQWFIHNQVKCSWTSPWTSEPLTHSLSAQRSSQFDRTPPTSTITNRQKRSPTVNWSYQNSINLLVKVGDLGWLSIC